MSVWPMVELGTVADWGSGGTPSRGKSEYYGGDIPWATISDLPDGPFEVTNELITSEALQASSAKLVPSGSVLIAMYGASIGKLGLPQRSMATNQAIAFATPVVELLDRNYLFRFLQSQKAAFVAAGVGGAQPNISQNLLKAWKIPLPSLPEQRRIAAILDHADALRAKRREALAQLDELTQSIFIDMFGDAERVSLGPQLEFVTSGGRGWSKYYVETGEIFIRSLDVQMNRIEASDAAYVEAPDNAEARRTRTRSGDVLLTITGSRIGRAAPLEDKLAGSYVSQHVAILRPNGESIDPGFLSAFLCLPSGGQAQIARVQYGQTKPGLNFEQIRGLQVPVASLHRQQSYMNYAKKIEVLRGQQTAVLTELDDLFVSLQSRAFPGEL